jgi:CRP-like cAMP-binding protein
VPAGTQHEATITLAAPKHVIASRLSIQPESFSRILRNLQHEGHITVDGNLIIIKDISTLG